MKYALNVKPNQKMEIEKESKPMKEEVSKNS